MYYSPLRYPGGKGKLAKFMELIINQRGYQGGTYIEPFAGGAGIAIELLQKNVVSKIVINDYDKGIWSLWKAILTDTNRFINEIRNVPLTMNEWEKQREICLNNNKKYSFELGFATFYMNRTNRSGIIKGGVIGGLQQTGKWKIDARFNRESLVSRIESIASRKKDICLYNEDIRTFIEKYIPFYENKAMIYFDPPYFKKGKQLYMNYFGLDDHKSIERVIKKNVACDWIVTYDNTPEIREIYALYPTMLYDLNYSVSKKCRASELMIFKKDSLIPQNELLNQNNININLRMMSKDS
ncbi:DNA adenine methylase [Veillonella atypica]|uniref:DNA adenine methylase n=1 Tax=Veillonella atypica TaxID=39777 RepID=UPI000E4B46C5|nr:DNA adenine methylase [Veillonella atypica]RHL91771.1 DNA adenine methylase [Veillonella atypica]